MGIGYLKCLSQTLDLLRTQRSTVKEWVNSPNMKMFNKPSLSRSILVRWTIDKSFQSRLSIKRTWGMSRTTDLTTSATIWKSSNTKVLNPKKLVKMMWHLLKRRKGKLPSRNSWASSWLIKTERAKFLRLHLITINLEEALIIGRKMDPKVSNLWTVKRLCCKNRTLKIQINN